MKSIYKILALFTALLLACAPLSALAESPAGEIAADTLQQLLQQMNGQDGADQVGTDDTSDAAEDELDTADDELDTEDAETGTDDAEQLADEPDDTALDAEGEADAASDETQLATIDVAELDLSLLTEDELVLLRDRVLAEIASRGVVTGYLDLKRGDRGDDVTRLQERLAELGYYTGGINGKYDSVTQKAMKLFEKANGLVNDGDASRADQVTLYSDAAIAKADESGDTGDNGSGDTGKKSIREQQAEIDEAHKEYGDFDYTEVFRYMDKHTGEKVKIVGKVVQVLGTRTSGFQLRVATSGSSDVVYVFVNFDPGYNVLENDFLTIYGTITGTITYKSIYDQSITIPRVNADEIILR